ncbi:aromatic-amino-acid aminotransferase [Salmonella enterica]|nr:aromatic-amino-acid aminotransferase [Salmonella enterica]
MIEIVNARDLIPFLDIAYQGFGAGMDEDAYAIRAIASAGLPALVSNSFSKIFSLYSEKIFEKELLTNAGNPALAMARIA